MASKRKAAPDGAAGQRRNVSGLGGVPVLLVELEQAIVRGVKRLGAVAKQVREDRQKPRQNAAESEFIMNDEITLFNHEEFGTLRIITTEPEGAGPWFVAKDVAELLGYSNPADAISRHCKGVVKRYPLQTAGGAQEVRVIAEPDIYRLITHSKLPGAQKFEAWVFEDVLPDIRKHGGYLTPEKIEEALLNPDTIIRLATDLKAERAKRQELEAENEQMAPKALFADAVSASSTSILVGELAKLLRQNGVEIGQNRLFAWLRDKGYLMKQGSSYNMPTQRAMDMELFTIKETTITHSDGHTTISKTPKVTGKGQQYFVNVFLTEKVA